MIRIGITQLPHEYLRRYRCTQEPSQHIDLQLQRDSIYSSYAPGVLTEGKRLTKQTENIKHNFGNVIHHILYIPHHILAQGKGSIRDNVKSHAICDIL
jgi:hypothetical protein